MSIQFSSYGESGTEYSYPMLENQPDQEPTYLQDKVAKAAFKKDFQEPTYLQYKVAKAAFKKVFIAEFDPPAKKRCESNFLNYEELLLEEEEEVEENLPEVQTDIKLNLNSIKLLYGENIAKKCKKWATELAQTRRCGLDILRNGDNSYPKLQNHALFFNRALSDLRAFQELEKVKKKAELLLVQYGQKFGAENCDSSNEHDV